MSIQFYQHPEYDALRSDWELYRDLYEGRYQTLITPAYLWPHEFESDKVKGGDIFRRIREQRTRYVNLMRPIVKRFVSLVFQNEVNVSEIEAIFGDAIEDVDGEKHSFVEFIKLCAEQYFLNGRVYALVDSYGQQAQSALEEQQLGIRPYLERIDALEVPDWITEASESGRKGKFNVLRQEYDLLEPRDITEPPSMARYSKVMRADGAQYVIEFYKAEASNGKEQTTWQLVDETIVEGQIEIPVACMSGPSWVQDVAPIALLRHNTQSALDNALLFQGTQRILAAGNFPVDTPLAMNYGVLTIIPEGTTVTVIEPVQPIALQSRLEALTGDTWRVAFMQSRLMPTDSKAVEGADTMREGKGDLLEALRSVGQKIEDFANDCVVNFAAYKGQTDFAGRVKMDLDLDIEDLNAQLTIARQHWDEITKYPTWRREVNKKMALQQNLANVEDVIEEIENTDPADSIPDPLAAAQGRAAFMREITKGAEDEKPMMAEEDKEDPPADNEQ